MELIVNSGTEMINWLQQPWHWAFSGAAIALVLFLMTYLGRSFGVSTVLKDFCQIAGAGKRTAFFDFDIKEEYWRLAFVAGAIGGGYIGSTLLASPDAVAISQSTIEHLADWNIRYPQGNGFLPTDIFRFDSLKGVALAMTGGFLIGFGARYGGGCTSGHAISGLSHLQLPSLITVIGFFIGGLLMTWGILPLLFG